MGAGVAAGGLRPTPDDRGGPQVLVRCDSAGATHTFADACRAVGVGFSFGYAVDARVRDAAETLNEGDSVDRDTKVPLTIPFWISARASRARRSVV